MRGSVHITHHVRCEEVESGSASSGVAMIKSPLRVVVVQDEHFRASEKHFRARVAARNGLVLDSQSRGSARQHTHCVQVCSIRVRMAGTSQSVARFCTASYGRCLAVPVKCARERAAY